MKLFDIAQLVDGSLIGPSDININHLSPIDAISEGALVFAEDTAKLKIAEQSKCYAILVHENVQSEKKPVIQVASPFKSFITLLNHFYPKKSNAPEINKTACIGKNVTLGKNVSIGAHTVIEDDAKIGDNSVIMSQVYIGRDVSIGENCTIYPQSTIYDNCQIGDDVTIHASSVIGSDGFGYKYYNGEHIKIPHVGNVIIEDHVEIGANTVIDRATLGSTRIGKGTKIDNLVQIAHSVQLGSNNIVCAFTGIAGSTKSGNNVIFAANAGVSDHVNIDDDVIIGARAGVPPKKHLTQGNIYLGNPARPRNKALETELATSRLPMMRKTLKNLQQRVKELEEQLVNHDA